MFRLFAIKSLPIIAVAAEGVSIVADRWTPLINLGAIGCVLAWFLLRAEPRMRGIEDAINRQTRAMMLAVNAMHGVPTYTKQQATDIISEIESKK